MNTQEQANKNKSDAAQTQTSPTKKDAAGTNKRRQFPYIIFLLIVVILGLIYFLLTMNQPAEEETNELTIEQKREIMRNVAAEADPITLTDEEKQAVMEQNRASEETVFTPEEKARIMSDLKQNE